MKVGLFIPCYIDQFYPGVGIAVLEFLEKMGLDVEYPPDQTCCGQPLANSGMEKEAEKYAGKYRKVFSAYDYVVCPSGSCVHHVRDHYPDNSENQEDNSARERTYEFIEFIHDVLKIDRLDVKFPHKVAVVHGCHGLRGLRLESSSEMKIPVFSKNRDFLGQVKGIQLLSYEREDECCGFGGSFSIFEEAVSSRMGLDKLKFIAAAGAEYITGNDMSCLMHLEGLARREKLGLKFLHIAEILNFSG